MDETRGAKFIQNRRRLCGRAGLYLNISMLRREFSYACRRRAFKLQNRKLQRALCLM